MRKHKFKYATNLGVALEVHGIELSRAQLSRIVNGEFDQFRVDVLEALCIVLQCTPADLFAFDGRLKRSASGVAPAVSYRTGSLKAEPRAKLSVMPISARIHGL